MNKWICILVVLVLQLGCASDDRKLFLDEGKLHSQDPCGTESFLNRYAIYQCESIELEDNNDYINQSSPIHNIKAVVSSNQHRLLVVDEKIFAVQLREQDQEVLCHRRLQVVLSPGSGVGSAFQKGWLSYKPACFRFFNVKPSANEKGMGNLFTRHIIR